MKTIGIKLADGSFYPVLEDNTPSEKELELTTAHNNQTKVMVDLYRSATCSMDDAEYVDSLQIENLVAHPNGEPSITFSISLDEDNQLSAKIVDKETGNTSNTTITLVSRTLEERLVTDEYNLEDSINSEDTADTVVAGAAAAGGLLAAANAMDDSETETEIDTETRAEENTDLPDMNFDLPDETTANESFADASFTESTEEEQPQMPDDFFNMEDTSMNNTTFEDDTPAAGGLNFDGLYDDVPTQDASSEPQDDDVKKKTKVPVLICIICAVICIIATALVLFFIPSKYNLRTKKKANAAVEGKTVAMAEVAADAAKETTKQEAASKSLEATETPAPKVETKPTVPQAKEDEVIIIEKAEEVVPTQPPVAQKPKSITYKIKWGDTLWDIADTYYKNPWRYRYIARYNGISNPDYIISGTVITIPAE